jgi:hypothetical protein
MASTTLSLEHISPPTEDFDHHFDSVIDRLKIQKALPRESFPKEMPFFTFTSISKEAQVKELFQDISDPEMYRSLLKNIISLPEEKNQELISKRLSAMQIMSFAQIVLYKVLKCCEENCSNRPREVATHNQYKDYEYQCPFYHHEKDKRRLVLPSNIEEEFTYKANYFESMFHPLYYKMFRCKREYCNFSQFCPFYHSEEEKKTWDKVFSNFVRKDRISYVKDKQKYYEHPKNISDQLNSKTPNSKNTPLTPNSKDCPRTNYRPRTPKYQSGHISPGSKTGNDWKDSTNKENRDYNKGSKVNSAKKWDNKEDNKKSPKKGNTSPVGFGGQQLYDKREVLSNKAC